MDRASFLRSLNFLRPLPTDVWDSSVACIGDSTNQNDDGDGAYSGSTITPPTPSRNSNAVLVFNGPHIVVSIESSTSYDLIERRATTNGKKRGRGDDDDDDYEPEGTTTFRPMFFEHHPINNTKEGSTTNQKSEDMDVEPDDVENERKDTHWNNHINSDPSLCKFEVAIIKEIITSGTSALKNDVVRGSVITTPNKYPTDDYGLDAVESRTLLFRFGNRFVFHVNEYAISEILYEPGGSSKGGDKRSNDDDLNMDDAAAANGIEKRNVSSPPKKRQRHDNVENGSKPNVELKHLPPSVMIRFGSCMFRVFSLEVNNDNGSKSIASDQIARPASRIWGTLATNVDTIEDRLMNMRNTLIQQFDIDNRERKHAISFLSWRMAPPGSAHAFHTWQEMLLEKSSFFSYTPSRFVDEDWSRCLGDQKDETIDCPSSVSSPQKSSSPSKSGSNSTHFEQGQKGESSSQSKKGSAEDCNSGTHLKENNGIQPSESQSALLKEPEINVEETLLLSSLHKPKNGCSSNSQSDSLNDKMDAEDDANNELSWLINICNKYHLFQTSAVQMELVNPVAIPLHYQGPVVSMKTRLTSCADMLTNSYMTVKEFKEQCQQSEDAIVTATTEIETVLENLFPARGKKMASIPSTGQQRSTESIKSIDELLSKRKEALAAKLALLMIPKR